MKPKIPKKPKCCQWMSGVCSPLTSTWKRCELKPLFRVWCDENGEGVCVGWVCAEHASQVVLQRIGQIN